MVPDEQIEIPNWTEMDGAAVGHTHELLKCKSFEDVTACEFPADISMEDYSKLFGGGIHEALRKAEEEAIELMSAANRGHELRDKLDQRMAHNRAYTAARNRGYGLVDAQDRADVVMHQLRRAYARRYLHESIGMASADLTYGSKELDPIHRLRLEGVILDCHGQFNRDEDVFTVDKLVTRSAGPRAR